MRLAKSTRNPKLHSIDSLELNRWPYTAHRSYMLIEQETSEIFNYGWQIRAASSK